MSNLFTYLFPPVPSLTWRRPLCPSGCTRVLDYKKLSMLSYAMLRYTLVSSRAVTAHNLFQKRSLIAVCPVALLVLNVTGKIWRKTKPDRWRCLVYFLLLLLFFPPLSCLRRVFSSRERPPLAPPRPVAQSKMAERQSTSRWRHYVAAGRNFRRQARHCTGRGKPCAHPKQHTTLNSTPQKLACTILTYTIQ